MSKIQDFLMKYFDAKRVAQSPLSVGGYFECWRIGTKIVPVQVHADGQCTLFLPPMVATENDLKTAIEDYLKDGFRRTVPVSAFRK